MPLDTAIERIEGAGRPFRVIPYVPPRAGEPAIAEAACWRVVAVRPGAGGVLDVVAVPAGPEAVRLGGERGLPARSGQGPDLPARSGQGPDLPSLSGQGPDLPGRSGQGPDLPA